MSYLGFSYFVEAHVLFILYSTDKPSTTYPKTVCLLSNYGHSERVIKNWLPFVWGPELAIDKIPAFVWDSFSLN